ncbi:hypothetical protein ES703_18241 [subsurface metagenome]
MPGAVFACVVCKVQGWESVGLRVMIWVPAGVVFPSDIPAVVGLLPWIGGAAARARDNFYYVGVGISKWAARFACVDLQI